MFGIAPYRGQTLIVFIAMFVMVLLKCTIGGMIVSHPQILSWGSRGTDEQTKNLEFCCT